MVNLWKFLTAEGATKFEYYNHNNKQDGKPMLDMIHDMEDIPDPTNMKADDDTSYEPYQEAADAPLNEPEDTNDLDMTDNTAPAVTAPKRTIRLAK